MVDFGSLLGGAGLGGAIGKAIVQLELDTGKYNAELKATQAQTTASANTMGGSFSKFGSIAQTALLGAGVAAVAFGTIAVKAAIEANEAHLKLQNTFENNPRLADSSVEAFEAQADALRALTGVDDEAIISGQALLGQFKLTGEQVQEITPAIVDLSAKMSIDLEAAFKAVGKATSGSAGILSRYGVVLDEDKLKADAFGTTLEGLGVAAGFAEERANAEPWSVLGSELEELAEQVGVVLIPFVQKLVVILGELAEAASFVAEQFDKFGTFTPSEESLRATELYKQELQGVSDLYHEGAINQAQYEENLLAIAARFNDSIDPIVHFEQAERVLQATTEDTGDEIDTTKKKVIEFAHLTGKELRDWRQTTQETFHDFIFDLESSTKETRISEREFADAFAGMREDARRLRDAMRELRHDKWVNDEFIEFLSEKGPEWLITFTSLNKTQQQKFQEDWDKSNQRTKTANENLDVMIGLLDKMDKGESKHKVIIEYEYQGFDPTKPGMAGAQRSG